MTDQDELIKRSYKLLGRIAHNMFGSLPDWLIEDMVQEALANAWRRDMIEETYNTAYKNLLIDAYHSNKSKILTVDPHSQLAVNLSSFPDPVSDEERFETEDFLLKWRRDRFNVAREIETRALLGTTPLSPEDLVEFTKESPWAHVQKAQYGEGG